MIAHQFTTFDDGRLLFRDPNGEVVLSFNAKHPDFADLFAWYQAWANDPDPDPEQLPIEIESEGSRILRRHAERAAGLGG